MSISSVFIIVMTIFKKFVFLRLQSSELLKFDVRKFFGFPHDEDTSFVSCFDILRVVLMHQSADGFCPNSFSGISPLRKTVCISDDTDETDADIIIAIEEENLDNTTTIRVRPNFEKE